MTYWIIVKTDTGKPIPYGREWMRVGEFGRADETIEIAPRFLVENGCPTLFSTRAIAKAHTRKGEGEGVVQVKLVTFGVMYSSK